MYLTQIHARLRAGFASRKLRSIEFRKAQLSQLAYLISDNKEAIARALKQDLGRPEFETDVYVPFPYTRLRTSWVNMSMVVWKLAER
jgi:acyl-CoA reductase-like NAD-dependent aldehyde dehydrogenase